MAWDILFLTSVQDGGEWSASRSSHFTHGEKNPWYPWNRQLDRPRSQHRHFGEEKVKSLDLAGFQTSLSSPLCGHYTS